jgi:hypothetical protein
MKSIILFFTLLFSLTIVAQIPNYVSSNGLVGWWPFIGNANDLSGNGNNGTVNGATLTTDRFGVANQAYFLNSNPQYISFPNGSNSMLNLTGDFSISFWIKTSSSSSNNGFLNIGDNVASPPTAGGIVSGLTGGGKFGIGIRGNWYSSNSFVNNNAWHLISATYSSGVLKIYIDGLLDSTFISIPTPLPWSGNRTFGCRTDLFMNSNTNYIGFSDDIGIWNRALTQTEITALYTSTAGTVSALNCNSFTQTGNLFSGQAAANVSVSVPYTGGNAGFYAGQSIASTGVAGLTATRTSGTLANGNGTVSYTITGTPSAVGNATFAISLGGQACNLVLPVTTLTSQYPAGSVFCASGPTAIVDVTNPTTGKTWMDRNLGASQVATSSTDQNAYGDLYQWGRRSDGHQCRTSATTATLSSVDQPAHGSFILAPNAPTDWRNPQNAILWQGINGVNNPCPSGYRIPTEIELNNEQISWTNQNSVGAINSYLKIPLSGDRYNNNGTLNGLNQYASIWSSNTSSTFSRDMVINSSGIAFNNNDRADGRTIRCIKETVGSVGALNCNGTIQTGNLIINQAATSVSASVPYTSGNGGVYNAQTLSSTGVTGLTATLAAGTLANGAGSLTYTITGTPTTSGTASFAISIGGQSCTLNLVVYNVQPAYPAGTVNCNGNATIVNDVTNPTTGKTWMDRNLGASQVATSSTDAASYGDLYQWGRRADGHQCRTSPTTATLSSVDQPAHGDFIMAPNAPCNWRTTQNNTLWQGAAGNNNPCPSGYRLPTNVELDQDRLSWSTNNSAGAINSILKLGNTGYRFYGTGVLTQVNTLGKYWSSTTSGISCQGLSFDGSLASIAAHNRAYALSVRCIKETVGTIDAINCNGTTQSGTLYNNQPVSSVTASVPYTGGNGGYYPTQSIASTGVTGLTASLTNGLFANGAGTLSFTISGTPSAVGTATFALNIGGQACSFTLTVQSFATLSINTNDTICNGTSTTLTASVANAGTSCAAPGLSGTLTNGLVGYWPFCGNANDLSGNGNNGTVNGATLTTDRFGAANSAYSFDGVNDYIEVQDNASLNNPNISVGLWLNTNSAIFQQLLYKVSLNTAQNEEYSMPINLGAPNKINLDLKNNSCTPGIGWMTFSSNAILNNWVHASFTHDGSTTKFYLNGALVNSQVANFNIANCPGGKLIMGIAWDLQNGLNGKLDDIAIYNRAITQQEVTQLYQHGQATYLWSNGATTPGITVSPTQTTTYTCTITMNGATTTQSQTITVNPIPTVNAGVDQTVFAGTQVSLVGSGANSYSWNNGISNNTPFAATTTTTYTVTGTSNGCSSTDQVLVTVLPAPNLTINTNDTICNGTSTTLTASVANAGTSCAAPGLSGTLTNGLVGYWPFCGNANDLSGNGNNGTVNGATLTTDRFGVANQAYSFDGVNDYINIGNNNIFNLNTMTISLWYNENSLPLPGSAHTMLSKSTSNNGEIGYRLEIASDGLEYYVQSQLGIIQPGTGFITISNVIPNNWSLINIVKSAGTVNVYKNGQNLGVNSNLYSLIINNSNLLFGAVTNQNLVSGFFNGKLDDIIIYNRALTQQEITQLYQQGQATYVWSNGATTPGITVSPTQTTTYTCTITMNGASTTQSQTITVNPIPTVNAGGDQTVFAGAQVSLVGSGANSYSWNNGISNNTPFAATTTTTYTVTGTSNGCSSTDQVLVTVLPAPTLSINTNDTICNGTSTTLTASVANAGTSCAAPGLSGTLINGLVGYWPFCGNANDLSGNSNHGTVNGATLTTDRFGVANQAYSFDGTLNQDITGNLLNVPSSQFSISAWTLKNSINTATYPNNLNQWVFSFGTPNQNNGFHLGLYGNNTSIVYGTWGNAQTSVSQYSNSWDLVNVVYTNGTYSVYKNGVLVNNVNSAISLIGSSFTIGNQIGNLNEYWNGKLDDIGLWNRALTQQEITQLYQQGQATYLWSNGATTPSITVSPAQTTSYTCTITMGGASTTQSQTIAVNALPTVTSTANQTVCVGTSVTLNGSGASSYAWNNNVQNGVAFVPNATTTYTVTGTNANGCINTAQTTVTVNPLPAATITAQGATTFCQNNSLTLTANAGAGLSYQWYNNGTAINAANSATLPVSTSGSYTVQVTNANNCSVTSSATAVSVNALPAATVTPASATTFCQGGSVVLNANVGQGLYYQWNLNGSPINGANLATYTANATGNYSLDVLNSDGCSATSSVVSVIVNALPNVSGGANQTICAGTVLTLSGSGASTYSWNNNVQNGVAFTPNATQTYTITGTNVNGCANTAQVTITVNALPTPSISYVGSIILCQGSVLALNSSAGSSYLWSNGQTTSTIQVSQGGAYTVQVSNANGCVGTSNAVNITVNPLPAPSITAQGPTTFCQGGSVVLTSTGATSYSWSTNAITQSITVNTSGQYQITVVDNNGCSGSSAPIQVTVLSPPSATVSTIGANALCAGQSTTLSAPAGNTYLWSNGSTTQNITVTTAGTYSVQVTNGVGCSATSTPISISVNPVPAATITPNGVTSFCNGNSVVLTASAGNTYLWNTGATTQSITVNAPGSFTATVTGVGGCNATSAATTVTVNALPAATITPNGSTTFCAGGTLLLSASAGSSYLWSNGVNTPSLSVNASGSYTVTVTNGAGCSVTSSPVNVTVNALPTLSAGANQTLCAGSPVTLSGSGATTYSWNNGVTNGVTFTPATTQSYTVTGTAANGCTNTAQVTVTVNALPTVSAGANQTLCAGTALSLNGTGATTYAWNNGVTNGVTFTPANTQTYTVTGTAANGCTNTAQVTVTVNALPTVSAGANQTLCAGSPVTLSGSGATTYAWNNGVTNGVTFTPATTQTYTVTGTAANGCTNTAQVTVTVNALPTVSAGANQTLCAGSPVTLSGSGATTYAWNNGVTNGVTFTPATTQTYTVTGTAANGCTNTAQVTVTVNALPTVSAGANQTLCAGSPVTLSGSGATTYAWNNGVTNGVTFTPATTQTYTVTGTAANGCTNTAQVTVTVNALPTVSAGANQTLCAGSPVSLSGSGATTYAWNNGVTNGVTFTPATTQTYTVTGTAANGCTNTAQVTVTINALPTVSAGANQTLCAGSPVSLSGSGATTYAWNNGVTNGVTFTPATTQTYTVTGTAANGCTNTAQVTVTVNALPTVSAGANQTLCAGSPVSLSGSGATTYAWNNGVANGVTFTPATTQTYTVTGTAANGCTNTAQVTVTVNALPTVSAGANQTVCAGTPVSLNGTGATTYSWNNGVTNGVNFTPANTQTYTVTGTNANGCANTAQVTVTVNALPTVSAGANQTLCAGTALILNGTGATTYAWNNGVTNGVTFTPATTQTYTVTGTAANGCTNTAQVTVTVNALPTVSAGANQTLCAGSPVSLSGSGATTYAWNNGVTNGVTFTPATTQTYTVTGTAANGCTNTAQVTVTVNALPTVSAGANQTLCAGTALSLNGTGATTYAWNNGVTNGVTFTPANTQTYTVTGTAANGCTNTAQVTVTVNALPTVSAGANQTLCAGTLVTLSGSGATTYAWNNGVTNGVTFTPATTQTYTVTGTAANGCTNTAQVTVTVNALPTVSAGANQTLCAGSPVSLSGSGATTYAWNNGVTNGVTFTPATTQTYTVTGTAANGCTNTAQVTVTVNALPTVSAGANQTLCAGTALILNGTGATTYAWNNGVTNGVTFTPATTQTYTVTGTAANGCTNTAQVTVTINALPTVSAGANQTLCAGSPVSLSGSGATTYAWNNGVTNGVAFTPVNTQTYTVTGTNANGCANTAQVTVTVNALPTVSAGANQTVCAGSSVTLSGTGATSYVWNNGVTNATPFTPTNTQTYTVTGTNANGCTNTAQVTVTVNPLPSPTLLAIGTSPYCPGTSVLLSTTSMAGYVYQWYIGQNSINGAISANYSATVAGLYSVLVTAPGGCFATSNSIGVSYLNPTIIALGPTSICQGGNVVLQTVAGVGFQYTWMKNGMSMMNSSNFATFTVTSPGIYKVKIVTPSGCVMYSNSITISFLSNPTASISGSGSLNICAGNSITLSAANNTNAVTYQWRKNGINISGATSQTYVATQSGTYTVVIANQACPATSAVVSNTLTVQVFPTPNPLISTTGTFVTPGVSVTLSTANVAGNTYQWQKLIGTTFIAIQGATQSSYTTSSSGTYRVKVTNIYGCWKNSNSITIASSQMPEQGVSCLSDGIHVKLASDVPENGIWYEETEQARTRIETSWMEDSREWILTETGTGNYVYITIEEEMEQQWMRIVDVCEDGGIVAYPNPTWNVFYLKGLDLEDKHYELYDLMGRIVAVGNISSASNAVDISSLDPGTYRLVIQGGGMISIVKE